MRIVFVIASLSSGGAERATSNLANYWAGRGWDVTIITFTDDEQDFYELHPAIHRIGLNLSFASSHFFAAFAANIRRASALRRTLRELSPDVSISMMTSSNILLALAARNLPGLVTIGSERVHPPQVDLGVVWTWLRRQSYGYLSRIVALTSESQTWLKNKTSARDVYVIPNAVNWPLPKTEPIVLPSLVLQKQRKTILAVGRLDRQKGFDLLISVFSMLCSEYPEWDLVILGEGNLRNQLEQQIMELQLEERIKLPGRVGNIGDWYEASDLFVMSSRFEGFPNTLVEAMAYGLPVISFDCDTGPRDIIRHGLDGLLVNNCDVNALEEALFQLMADESKRLQYAERAIEVRQCFSIDKIAGMWEKLFKDIKNEST